MIRIRVKFDKAAFKRDLDKIQKNVVPKVMARALNRAADSVKAEAVRTLAKMTSIKQTEIRFRMFVKGATPQRLWAEVGVLPYAPTLRKFRPRQSKQGVIANAWGQRVTYRGSFKTPSGAVVSRIPGQRGKVKALYGPSLPNTFMRKIALQRFEAVARQKWRSEFEREMARRLASAL